MRIVADWLQQPAAQAVFVTLTSAGHQALAVGGCVRNALLQVPVKDVDIATDAIPERVTELVQAAGMKAVPTGFDHGTVTVVSQGASFEVTTFRRDIETDGRHAVVAFSTRVEEDAARRDFTMNALYATADGLVIDPLGGLPDVLARRVRFVGTPADRIAEDYLRILRFFRFFALYGTAGLDADGLAACASAAEGINRLSRERIGAEMRKLLSAADPAPALAAMAHAGVLARVLPGADPRPLAPLVHLERDGAPDWMRRLAALGGEDPPERLRLSGAEARDLAALRDAIGNMATPAVLGWRMGLGRGTDAMLLRAAVLDQSLPPDWMGEVSRGAAAIFPIAAVDLMPALQGPGLGARLKHLQADWIASDLRKTRAELLG